MARRKKGRDVSGWVVVDKPEGLTSNAVVGKLRWAFGAKKAGHAGTLDPAATGVLAIAFGEATKTVPYVTDALKCYDFTVRFGQATNTDDAEGEVTETSDVRPSDDEIRAALPAFAGEIMQVPPAFSAVKIDGERAYARARAGEDVALDPRPLWVESLEMTGRPDPDHATLRMVCGKGGYVRAIARDLGQSLGCLGHVTTLRRTWSGPFRAEDGVTLDRVEELAHSPGDRRVASAARDRPGRPPRSPLQRGLGSPPSPWQSGGSDCHECGIRGRGLGIAQGPGCRGRDLPGRDAASVAGVPDVIERTFQKGDAASVAVYSECERFRYTLTRTWDAGGGKVAFVMLNPSTATERQNDPTVERCERRARALGFGSFRVCNIFAWRETDPAKMRKAEDPVGPGNDDAIREACAWADRIVCAWGTHGAHLDRGPEVERLMRATGRELHHLGLTKDGHPKHPLYIAYREQPQPWG